MHEHAAPPAARRAPRWIWLAILVAALSPFLAQAAEASPTPAGASGALPGARVVSHVTAGTYLGFTNELQVAQFRLVLSGSGHRFRFRADSADFSGVTFNTTRGTVTVSGSRLTFRLADGTTTPGTFVSRASFQGVRSSLIRIPRCGLLFSSALDRVYRCQFLGPQ